jgi:hypothetical protein
LKIDRGHLVGAVRFELTTTGTPCRYATRLRYAPKECPIIPKHLPLPSQYVQDIFKLYSS